MHALHHDSVPLTVHVRDKDGSSQNYHTINLHFDRNFWIFDRMVNNLYYRKLVCGFIIQLSLCGFRGICNQSPVHCIIMEFCPNGQLYEVLRNGRQITPSLLIKWSKQIADGMHYLHLQKIIHRDLKSPK